MAQFVDKTYKLISACVAAETEERSPAFANSLCNSQALKPFVHHHTSLHLQCCLTLFPSPPPKKTANKEKSKRDSVSFSEQINQSNEETKTLLFPPHQLKGKAVLFSGLVYP